MDSHKTRYIYEKHSVLRLKNKNTVVISITVISRLHRALGTGGSHL
jgi:hypothetical protein